MNTKELREKMSKLEMPLSSRPPYWDYWRAELHNSVMRDSPENFTNWPIIRHTMLMDHLPIESSWQIVMPHIKHYRHYIQPPEVGLPDWYNGCSRTMVEQCAFVAQWEQSSGRSISDLDRIVELGGGFGAMALLVHRLGFTGRYIIFDFPEMSLFQQWFLSQHDIEAEHITSMQSVERVIHADMLIAIDSLSETSLEFRDEFLSKFVVDNYLFRYSPNWDTYNNELYFAELKAQRNDLMWVEWSAKGWVSTGMVAW